MINSFTKIFFISMIVFVSGKSYGQFNSLGFGLNLGIGQIKSVSPSLTSFTGSVFLEAEPKFTKDVSFLLSFLYARKVEYFLPEDRRNRYFPFVKGFSLRAVIQQPFNEKFFLEEGTGLLYLNDRVFNDVDSWNFGFVVHLLIGVNLKIPYSTGFELGFGGEYGGTVTNTKASYSYLFVQVKYKLVE